MATMKKCLVLDLDNTLWGGIIGEDGMENIQLSVTAPGNSFLAFQQAILDLYDRGIILAINSRNNPADAWQVIKTHPNMILKENHFAAHRINWNDKAANIRELAKELNIGLDSMVFLDDDSTNREMVKALVPEVEVPELPADPRQYARFLNSLTYFDSKVITDEDKMRGNLYVTERLRKEEEKSHTNKEDFLQSLDLELLIHENDESSIPRLSQLSEKTNQFNNLKQPFTEEQMKQFMRDPSHTVLHGKLSDKFGDSGLIISAVIEKNKNGKKDGAKNADGKNWHIKSLLMSCRVFGRGVEDAFFAEIMKKAYNEGASDISISFKESEKNAPAKTFIEANFKNGTVKVTNKISAPRWVQTKHGKI